MLHKANVYKSEAGLGMMWPELLNRGYCFPPVLFYLAFRVAVKR